MTTKQKYILAYRLLRYYGDWATFHSMCFSYEIEWSIRELAYISYMQNQ